MSLFSNYFNVYDIYNDIICQKTHKIIEVGGLLSNLGLFPFMGRASVNDINNAIISGTYITSNITGNLPISDWSFLCVFAHDIYVIQLLYALNYDNKLYIRKSINKGGNWTLWKLIATN